MSIKLSKYQSNCQNINQIVKISIKLWKCKSNCQNINQIVTIPNVSVIRACGLGWRIDYIVIFSILYWSESDGELRIRLCNCSWVGLGLSTMDPIQWIGQLRIRLCNCSWIGLVWPVATFISSSLSSGRPEFIHLFGATGSTSSWDAMCCVVCWHTGVAPGWCSLVSGRARAGQWTLRTAGAGAAHWVRTPAGQVWEKGDSWLLQQCGQNGGAGRVEWKRMFKERLAAGREKYQCQLRSR